MRSSICGILIFFCLALVGQGYAPPAGQPGTTAIHKDSSVIIAWCTQATVQRGPMDISNPSAGSATVGTSSSVTGPADISDVLSLGDGGKVTCEFSKPIMNGAGADFAVFENSIDDTFLELAFVEVSSDGITYFRFPAHSLTDTVTQTSSFGATDATRINNLAGKYRGGFGTPFDLQELAGQQGLDVNSVTHVRIVDVVGSITTAYATRDSYNNKVNDPWPTFFGSSGFDLDAIGVIHQKSATAIADRMMPSVVPYPNPVRQGQKVHFNSNQSHHFVIFDAWGREVKSSENSFEPEEPGIYTLIVYGSQNVAYSARIVVLD